MPRLITWNANGNTVLTAAQRNMVEASIRAARRDILLPVGVAPPPQTVITRGNQVFVDDVLSGTIAGTDDLPIDRGNQGNQT